MRIRMLAALGVCCFGLSSVAYAAPVTDPNDPRSWQGATVGTFAALIYGADTLANRELVVDFANGGANSLLDDGLFNPAGSTPAPMISSAGVVSSGTSLDLTGTGSYGYVQPSILGVPGAGDFVDEHWLQTGNTIGAAVWDLGAAAPKAAIFNTIDHGPLPGEAIESSVYLSNDLVTWELAETQRVWLEGFMSNTGILWDGFAYAVGTDDNDPFRYVSIIWGGPGALLSDGDNEINGVLGLDINFNPIPAPEPGTLALVGAGLAALGLIRRRRKAKT
jgi:hypothetical protein